jgi:hypothetical protein
VKETLFLKLKECEEKCYQIRNQINFVRHHQIHQKFNQIKSVKAERLHEPFMKIAQKLLINDKATFEQLTPSIHNLWTQFQTEVIYRFLTGEPDTEPEFKYNWTSIPSISTFGANHKCSTFTCSNNSSFYTRSTATTTC